MEQKLKQMNINKECMRKGISNKKFENKKERDELCDSREKERRVVLRLSLSGLELS